ncbi:DUF1214 domain-containing protein [Mycolicibacterium sp. CH28]|uniref:DUF1214 domain-containing protein n=1 Tax=Mycolicibacterium sp. CH28 TaxID=2512237 RepID=UPI001081683C|nr:DUF1214 domain-containing protein [Mycolicibacterium sp. CH28]TGD84297.1 DUF1214 domain-containing protein [Mycolicibacterium sp. CH28]
MSGEKSLEAWSFVRKVFDDLTEQIKQDARDERELLEGIRVLNRVMALCTELSVDIDPDRPHFVDMTTPFRFVGGPNPHGSYPLAMISGDRAYRVSGTRGTSTYLGLQVLAGAGMNPRRMSNYLSDRDLVLDDNGRFTIVFAAARPDDSELAGAQWISIPDDATSIVVRDYVADPATEIPSQLEISRLGQAPPPAPLTDELLAAQLTAMGWTIVKLTTLHRTVRPDLLDTPNTLITSGAENLGGENTTPDNLYMLGLFDLDVHQSLQLEFEPPETRYWSVTLESIWHECLEPLNRTSSVTNRGVTPDADGRIRLSIGAEDDGHGFWLDTGGRRRGFVIVRWLDSPNAPEVTVRLLEKEVQR